MEEEKDLSKNTLPAECAHLLWRDIQRKEDGFSVRWTGPLRKQEKVGLEEWIGIQLFPYGFEKMALNLWSEK